METPRRPTGERAERKRRQIVRAAREIFVREGFDAGMDAIAAEAGVSKVTVYNHFGGKENLFLAVIGDALEEVLGETVTGSARRMEESGDLREALRWAARGWAEGLGRPDVRALRDLVVGQGKRFPELGEAWRLNGPERARPGLAAIFGRLVAEGRLEMPDVDLAIVQLYALVLYPQLIHNQYGTPLDAKTTEALIDGGVDMFLGYYRYRES
ncbi:hypothetical protein Afil01_11800 [Actinorhabdospora filicis]|uniref:HTH tetR-type domain-containing protein n=1 Tax=Actinorhabdospora filicis TaxID=1785913 RepID=A0A9W6W7X5_9ACTN|nr:TetR/AcrR family transcriptional regulator [Actinorhabdospora filicis]GLZ76373.1 hypothetical protein Afil01_11800 [Actinorhabdospora filicis]